MAGQSPTSRSMERLRRGGYTVDKVEQRVVKFVTRDLFGIIDLLAMRAGELLAVQVTSSDHLATRITKCLAAEELRIWLSIQGARFECWGWALRGARGERKLWTLRRVELLLVGEEVEVINHESQEK